VVAPKKNSTLALIDELLAEQSRLQTPVARFAAIHSNARTSALTSQLIPLSLPKPGEQYAFEVDLDACTGCKACVSACHALNGLDDDEAWRDVGLITGGTQSKPYQQTVTTACHHCADPACLNGCPVLAYEKDPITGIVRHLDDQCIGCQYCVLKCPYDVPKYNERLGIVRKCDMCQQRLAVGEAPACVQACPTQAISIVTVVTNCDGASAPDTSSFLPTAPDPEYTRPVTRYLTGRPGPDNLLAADNAILRLQPAHWPLAVMLTLLPFAVGAQIAVVALSTSHNAAPRLHQLALLAWGAGAAGLLASVAHLGKPLRAWRIFLGWRKSWLSREAVVFSVWFGLTTVALKFPAALPSAIVFGVGGLFCSVMIYVDTRRRLWRFSQTAPRFFGNAFLPAAAAVFAFGFETKISLVVLGGATALKLVCEAQLMRPLDLTDADDPLTPALHSARLLNGPLRPLFGLRIAAAVLTAFLLPIPIMTGRLPLWTAWFVFASALLGELLERHLFFRAVDAPKMPGVAA
jgi:Fe-S-cluster-containing dehydrogenase component/DMSO reductase anchor subunit